jgi:hypothetical protein
VAASGLIAEGRTLDRHLTGAVTPPDVVEREGIQQRSALPLLDTKTELIFP